MVVKRVDFKELISWMPEDLLILVKDLQENMEFVEKEVEEHRILFKDAVNAMLKDVLTTHMKLLRDIDLRKIDPLSSGSDEPNVAATAVGLGIPKDDFEAGVKMYLYAMMDIADACWISDPTVIKLEDEEYKAKAFRCFKVTGTSYFLVQSLYDIYKEEEKNNTMIYEIFLLRMPKHTEFYSALISTLTRNDRKDMLDVLKNIDEIINALHVAEKIMPSGPSKLESQLSSSTYFQ